MLYTLTHTAVTIHSRVSKHSRKRKTKSCAQVTTCRRLDSVIYLGFQVSATRHRRVNLFDVDHLIIFIPAQLLGIYSID